ncbi:MULTISPECIES: 50S ribosomal protein L25 [Emticicia]|uniref:50S ribosomal protein L25 n=1 Tax=Emticicia TaxID=312278 RepID=UPI00209FB629|nr:MULTISPECIES: 50S ribosomal protein L25 [Emticicia]UTA70214.1 50S ribosomal protein L25 [Emticicia sp. 21SJ11W-3]
MKKTEIVGYNRANLGRQASQELRAQGMVPCVLYGGADQVSFYAPAYLFRDLLFTPDAYEVTINIEGKVYTGILQDSQYHPVNDQIIHADFLEITPDKIIKVAVPIKLHGPSEGQKKGGKLVQKMQKLRLQGPAKHIPDYVNVDIKDLDLGKSIKVGAIGEIEGVKILDAASNPLAVITIPRSLRQQ